MTAAALTSPAQRALLWKLILLGIGLRVIIAIGAPRADGYVWDLYHEGVVHLYETGRLPTARDAWQGYHPPLYYITALPFYALGVAISKRENVADDPDLPLPWVCAMSAIAGIVAIFYSWKLLRLYDVTGWHLVVSFALLMVFPALLFTSWSTEADMLLSAILMAFLYYLARYHIGGSKLRGFDHLRIVFILGILSGLAAATKYSGLIALLTGVVVALLQVVRWRGGRPMIDALLIFSLTAAIGGWKYADNHREHGTAFFANGSAAEGFSLQKERLYWERYEFHTLRLLSLFEAVDPDYQPETPLPLLKSYQSVWTALHALAWTDMGMFTIRGRTGGSGDMYPNRPVPVWLARSVIVVCLLPSLLAVVGFARAARRWKYAPLVIMTLLTLAAYAYWFLPQPAWALKTRHILFLLPAYLVFFADGVIWSEARLPSFVRKSGWVVLWVAVVLVAVYMMYFGRTAHSYILS